jgi:ribosomal-protein-alanine N-acetyltransferase
MSALIKPQTHWRFMTEADLDAVMAIENVVYTHPWTRGNFSDSLKAGSACWVLEVAGLIVGYAVVAVGAGEAHLLNLSVAAGWQRRGLGREILCYVFDFIDKIGADAIFLEVRVSNAAARALYAQAGFREIGRRRGYYPAHIGREDAIVLEFKPR